MPFRARMKKAFGRSSSGSSSSGNATPSGLPIEFYKPHEVPRSKYRGPWNQAHQDKLSAFNFAFGRKTSFQGSEYSPAQSRGPSRRGSVLGAARPSTRGSVSARSLRAGDRALGTVQQVTDHEGRDGLGHVRLSRRQTREKRGPTFAHDDPDDADNELGQTKTIVLPQFRHENDSPFSEEELTKALTEATLRPSSSRRGR